MSHEETFKGKIGRTMRDSKPWWPEPKRSDDGSPNVVIILFDDAGFALFGSQRRKGTPHAKRTYTYYPPVSHVPSEVAPTLGSRSWNMVVDMERDTDGDQGVLFADGTQNQGLSLFIKDNYLMFDYNIFTTHHKVRSDMAVPVGRVPVGVKFQRQGSQGTITLTIDGQACGSIQVPFVIRMIGSTGMDIGLDRLSPVSDEYKDLSPFTFTGTIHRVDIDLPKYRPPGEAKEKAVYADGRETNLSGAEAYGLYGLEMGKMIQADGGRSVFAAATNTLVIGEGELEWDMVAIAEYASLESFQKIMSSPEYQEIAKHREAGLAHQLLINLK